LLYDARYSEAGSVLQALAIRAVFLSFACPAEDLLITVGQFHVILIGNVLRASWIVLASLIGYYFFGFSGFVYGLSLSGLPPLAYYWWLQKSKDMFIVKYECYKVAFALAVGVTSYIGSALFLMLLPGLRIRL
jgi:O-antigen/teichoic acid export membrane protein